MSNKTFEEIYPEIKELIKRGNYIRVSVLLRIAGHNKLHGDIVANYKPRELALAVDLLACERALEQVMSVSKVEQVYTKTQLNKMKKAELVDLFLGE